MGSMLINGFGITSEGTKCLKEKPIPIRWKQIMLNSGTIWLAWRANHVVFLAVLMLWNARYAYLCIVSTVGNFTSSVFLTMHLT